MLSKKRGDNEQAAVCLKRVRALHQREVSSGDANAENSKGISLMNQGKLTEALTAFRRALQIDPKYVVSAYNIGVVLAHQGDQDAAITAFRNAIDLRPSFGPAHLGLGLVLRMRRDPTADLELRTAAMLNSLTPAGPRPGIAPALGSNP
jgi:tetratricopeptide (TPR) repeat protein